MSLSIARILGNALSEEQINHFISRKMYLHKNVDNGKLNINVNLFLFVEQLLDLACCASILLVHI